MIAPLRQLLRYHHDQRLYADLVHARKSLLRGQDCKQPIICQPSKADYIACYLFFLFTCMFSICHFFDKSLICSSNLFFSKNTIRFKPTFSQFCRFLLKLSRPSRIELNSTQRASVVFRISTFATRR